MTAGHDPVGASTRLHRVNDMPTAAALALDAVLVTAFAALGRSSHAEQLTVAGVAATAWPFLLGLVVGWAVAALLGRRTPLTVRAAWPVWLLTVAVGMLLRRSSGAGTAAAFVVVATVTLGVLLLGWRALVTAVRRRSATAGTDGRAR